MKTLEFKTLLIVEDNPALRGDLVAHFQAMNNVTACACLAEAVNEVAKKKFDIILLDVILPDGSGLKLFEYIEDTPVVILSDLGSDSNLIEGFCAGAMDYIVKPASMELIEMRLSLRLLPDSQAKLNSHGLELDMSKRTASYDGKPLDLTSSEFNILMFLMQNSGNFYTATEIYEQVWKMPFLNTTTIKVHLSNLRKKMQAASPKCTALIITEFGKGYAFIGGANE